MTDRSDDPAAPGANPPIPPSSRPRDEAGRPLPMGTPSRLALPDFDAMTMDVAHLEAIRLFDEGNYFGAHEAWETCWALSKDSHEEEFFKGLAQLGAGYTHWMRGNAHGVVALLGRALERIGLMGSPYGGVDVEAFVAQVTEVRALAQQAERDATPLPVLSRRSVPRG
ncbi:MAG: DUF309 domain-containing protein [Chloroflexi bacterium]|nr:DUF309 domain-containing protein [Chloroflexota bacterium]MDA1240285.1 DUF309 domain-containing protein [Chloroflexota bacterium]MQC47998.1 DUF309 domain-containing protein [Chloroflexota bacterium]